MVKYNYLFGTKEFQLDISPDEPLSDYTYEFTSIDNIVGIKLLSYSVPTPRYNIEVNKNNLFKIYIDGEYKECKLNNGKYQIDDILKILSNKLGINFTLNYEQKVVVESDNIFNIEQTTLSKEVLGFTSDCLNEKTYTADNTWDLRIEDKIYLIIKNLDESSPFAVLYFNNQTSAQFKFEDPITLNKLELSFRDSKGKPYNFYGLNYNINLQLELHENANVELEL